MVLLLCLAFFGQAMASTMMSYHMMHMKGMSAKQPSHKMTNMSHSSHSMMGHAASSDSVESTEECCVKTCNCFTGGCSSVAALMKNLSHNLQSDFSSKIHSTSSLAQSQRLTSLYRPPILS